MQISRVVLVYDVKINQVGRKNLAVRFDMYQIGGSSKNPVAGCEEIGEILRGAWDRLSGMERHERFEHAFKID
jgi:hypothetical protein